MHTIDTQAKDHGMDAAQRQIVMARTREQIGYSIGGDSYPEMRVREQVQDQAEAKPQQQERER